MALAVVYSRASAGISAPLVTVEVHLSGGLARLHIVGLPETAVKESKDRVRSALLNAHFRFPGGHVTVNLAPADLPKEGGGRFDLPIALGVLAASGQLPQSALMEYEFTGELNFSGQLCAIRGILPVVLAAKAAGRKLIIPEANAAEAALVTQAHVLTAKHFLQVCAHLRGEEALSYCVTTDMAKPSITLPDLADVRGQAHAKRALEIAAAGQHSLMFIGPPGTGKTMLATRLPGILPELSQEQALSSAAIASITRQGFNPTKWRSVPFRTPHHSSSTAALVGGGRPPQPGEISLAHHGVLFLDELPEFDRNVLESLREPLESGTITISRASHQVVFPACFQFIAAMNPCPCGYAGSMVDDCYCSPEQIKRYLRKISGPLLDRIDMQVEVPRLEAGALAAKDQREECSAMIRERVVRVHQRQLERQGKFNAALTVPELERHATLENQSQALLDKAMQKFNFSARVYHRILKLARTVADLEESDCITAPHLSQALSWRCLDRNKSVV